MNRNSKILFIDGTSVFIRNWIQNPSMNDNGEPIGGVMGFINTLYEMIEMFQPTRIIIAFDGKSPLDWRRGINTEYKNTRFSELKFNRIYNILTNDDELKWLKNQFTMLYQLLQKLPTKIVSIERYESFDTISHLIKNNVTQNSLSIIISSNIDFIQFVNTKTIVYSPYKKIKYDTTITDDISTNMLFLYNVIHGNKRYGIPGVKNIGIKKFKKWFETNSCNTTLDDIINISKNNIDNSVIYRNIVAEEKLIRTNKLLMSPNIEIPPDNIIEINDIYNSPDTKFNKLKFLDKLNDFKMLHNIRNFNFMLDYTFSKIILQ